MNLKKNFVPAVFCCGTCSSVMDSLAAARSYNYSSCSTTPKIALNLEEYKKHFIRASADHLTRTEIRYLRSIPNEQQVSKAQELGSSRLETFEDVQKAVKTGKLVHLDEGRFWRINELKDSVRM